MELIEVDEEGKSSSSDSESRESADFAVTPMPLGPHPDQKVKNAIHSSVLLQTHLLKDTRRKTKEKEKLAKKTKQKEDAKTKRSAKSSSDTSEKEARRSTPAA